MMRFFTTLLALVSLLLLLVFAGVTPAAAAIPEKWRDGTAFLFGVFVFGPVLLFILWKARHHLAALWQRIIGFFARRRV